MELGTTFRNEVYRLFKERVGLFQNVGVLVPRRRNTNRYYFEKRVLPRRRNPLLGYGIVVLIKAVYLAAEKLEE